MLDNDEDILAYQFPDAATRTTIEGLTEIPDGPEGFEAIHGGPAAADLSPSSIRKEVHADSLVRTADVPLAIQLPIIHEWWPRIHPADAVTNPNDVWSGPKQTAYESARTNVSNNRASLISDQSTSFPRAGGLNDLTKDFSTGAKNWDVGGVQRTDQPASLQFYSKSVWAGLNKWDIMFTNKLEDLGDEIYRDHPVGLLGGQRLTWHQGGAHIYDMAPHKNQDDGRLEGPGPFPTRRTEQHYSTAWYQLSVMTESNQRGNQGNSSFDANYHHGHISFQRFPPFFHTETLRYLQSTVWLMQIHNNYTGWFTSGWQHSSGWENLHQHWPMSRLFNGSMHDGTPPQTAMDQVREEVIRNWLTISMQYDVNLWREGSQGSTYGDFGPIDISFSYEPEENIASQRDKYQGYVNTVGTIVNDHPTIAQSLVDSMAFWGQKMWPREVDEFLPFHSTGWTNPTLTVNGLGNGTVVDPAEDLIITISSSEPLDVIYVYRNGFRQATIDNPGTLVEDYNLGTAGSGVGRWSVVGYTADERSAYYGPDNIIASASSLPDGWASTRYPGNFAAANITFDDTDDSFRVGLKGGGLRSDRDDVPFLFRPMTDDGIVTARVKDLPNAGHFERGGAISLRKSLDNDSEHVSWFLNEYQTEIRRLERSSKGGGTTDNTVIDTGVPEWIRLTRSGNDVEFYTSSDGTSWTLQDTRTMSQGDLEWVGFTAQNRDHFADFYFWEIDNVTLDGPAFEPPEEQPPAAEELDVSLVNPTDGATFTAPAELSLEAEVTGGDPDDPVALVRFVVDGTVVAEDEDNAYSVTYEITDEGDLHPLRGG